ncbi:hypothetical protein C0581_00100 [Candidatus Parcubacteria bacterium]|nr:MAG: hypothetical protein C0581_00100 [Candidatus Parcubacteria bacterium]
MNRNGERIREGISVEDSGKEELSAEESVNIYRKLYKYLEATLKTLEEKDKGRANELQEHLGKYKAEFIAFMVRGEGDYKQRKVQTRELFERLLSDEKFTEFLPKVPQAMVDELHSIE